MVRLDRIPQSESHTSCFISVGRTHLWDPQAYSRVPFSVFVAVRAIQAVTTWDGYITPLGLSWWYAISLPDIGFHFHSQSIRGKKNNYPLQIQISHLVPILLLFKIDKLINNHSILQTTPCHPMSWEANFPRWDEVTMEAIVVSLFHTLLISRVSL